MKIIILGAGPCGLGAAYHLNKLGFADWQLFEKESYVGGLSASFVDGAGFTWDVGGHVLFSHYDYFDGAVADALGDAYHEHQRESWVRILETWVPYPFQNNVRYLPDHAVKECVDGLRSLAGSPEQAQHFRDWMDAVFGAGIVKHFMEPYNSKVWGVPLSLMSKQWIAERVSVVDLARIERNIAEQRDDLSWGPNNTFKFPKAGGTGAIYRGIAQRFENRIHLGHEMQSVDTEAKEIRFKNGRVESYDILINTTPLDLLVEACDAPQELRQAAGDLVHNGGLIVGLGVEAPRDDSKCWMYFPESNSPFYRVTNFHNYAATNVPEADTSRYCALMCETTYSPHKPEDKAAIIAQTEQGLVNSGMLSETEREHVVSRYLIDIPYSYPVPTIGRDRALAAIQPYLEKRGIFSRGRFGAWRYEVGNMDHSFMQGVEVIERILHSGDEPTLNGRA
ncbi:amine oxidase [Geomonas silvestris]|uniref:Amine oxidase n=1 Tax=Geomonas silvestris TaxID=2740184 RepID=A0A6V8MDC8_9BACT|nr:FAD-dependent oxidoreductase [Geomonas silvestris]GFO57942.1 amine oxidase [Geomonas silvestris]